MINIHSDSPVIKTSLENLVTLIINNGGELNPGIEIVSLNKELSVRSSLDHESHEKIIHIPSICIPSIDDFNTTLEGGNIVAVPKSKNNVSKLHVDIFMLMMDVYNLTGKIEAHRKSFPIFSLANTREILDHLIKGSKRGSVNDNTAYENNDIIRSFISTRQFIYNEYDKKRMVILPVMDNLNNHHRGIGFIRYQSKMPDEDSLCVLNSKPIASSDECFTSYDDDNDALGIYMKYGYVDVCSPIARSIPFTLDLGSLGKMIIHRLVLPYGPINTITQEKNLPCPSDLHYYFPGYQKIDNKTVEVSSLIIPSDSAPLALRRVLSILIRVLAPGINDEDLVKVVCYAESTILAKNYDYYYELECLVRSKSDANISSESIEILQLLIRTQKHHLSEYEKRLKNNR